MYQANIAVLRKLALKSLENNKEDYVSRDYVKPMDTKADKEAKVDKEQNNIESS